MLRLNDRGGIPLLGYLDLKPKEVRGFVLAAQLRLANANDHSGARAGGRLAPTDAHGRCSAGATQPSICAIY